MPETSSVVAPEATQGLAYSAFPTNWKNRFNLDSVGYLQSNQDSTAFKQDVPVVDAKAEMDKYDFSGVKNKDKDNGSTEGLGDKFSRWFTPNEKGTSLGGQVLGGLGTGVQAAAGLAGMYFTKKNYDLAKDAADIDKLKEYNLMARQAKVDSAGVDLSRNVGNGASYTYRPTVGN